MQQVLLNNFNLTLDNAWLSKKKRKILILNVTRSFWIKWIRKLFFKNNPLVWKVLVEKNKSFLAILREISGYLYFNNNNYYSSHHVLSYILIYITHRVFRFVGSAWISLAEPTSAGPWSLKMTADLSQRNDTGSINHSPVSSMSSSLVLYQSCLTSEINIPGKGYILTIQQYSIFFLFFPSLFFF